MKQTVLLVLLLATSASRARAQSPAAGTYPVDPRRLDRSRKRRIGAMIR